MTLSVPGFGSTINFGTYPGFGNQRRRPYSNPYPGKTQLSDAYNIPPSYYGNQGGNAWRFQVPGSQGNPLTGSQQQLWDKYFGTPYGGSTVYETLPSAERKAALDAMRLTPQQIVQQTPLGSMMGAPVYGGYGYGDPWGGYGYGYGNYPPQGQTAQQEMTPGQIATQENLAYRPGPGEQPAVGPTTPSGYGFLRHNVPPALIPIANPDFPDTGMFTFGTGPNAGGAWQVGEPPSSQDNYSDIQDWMWNLPEVQGLPQEVAAAYLRGEPVPDWYQPPESTVDQYLQGTGPSGPGPGGPFGSQITQQDLQGLGPGDVVQKGGSWVPDGTGGWRYEGGQVLRLYDTAGQGGGAPSPGYPPQSQDVFNPLTGEDYGLGVPFGGFPMGDAGLFPQGGGFLPGGLPPGFEMYGYPQPLPRYNPPPVIRPLEGQLTPPPEPAPVEQPAEPAPPAIAPPVDPSRWAQEDQGFSDFLNGIWDIPDWLSTAEEGAVSGNVLSDLGLPEIELPPPEPITPPALEYPADFFRSTGNSQGDQQAETSQTPYVPTPYEETISQITLGDRLSADQLNNLGVQLPAQGAPPVPIGNGKAVTADGLVVPDITPAGSLREGYDRNNLPSNPPRDYFYPGDTWPVSSDQEAGQGGNITWPNPRDLPYMQEVQDRLQQADQGPWFWNDVPNPAGQGGGQTAQWPENWGQMTADQRKQWVTDLLARGEMPPLGVVPGPNGTIAFSPPNPGPGGLPAGWQQQLWNRWMDWYQQQQGGGQTQVIPPPQPSPWKAQWATSPDDLTMMALHRPSVLNGIFYW